MSAMSMSSFLFKYDLSELHNPTQDTNHQHLHLITPRLKNIKKTLNPLIFQFHPNESLFIIHRKLRNINQELNSLQLPTIITTEHDDSDI